MIGLAMFLALAGTTDATAASPPIIVTTKSSTLCNAVRNVVAPSLRGLMVQDRMLDRGRSLLQDMSKMRVARADLWIEFENARLLNVVDDVASNNLKVHQLLDTLTALQLKDPSEAAELAALRGHLMPHGEVVASGFTAGPFYADAAGVLRRKTAAA